MKAPRSLPCCFFWFQVATAFQIHQPCSRGKSSDATLIRASKDESDKKGADAITKASWYAVETFGKVFSNSKSIGREIQSSTNSPPSSMKETQTRIQKDNEREYFLSGQVDKLIYSEDCTFADPFVSFSGRDRFVDNLRNLGSFITEYSARKLDYSVDEDSVTTKFMVTLELGLPWKPVLAWPWGVRCVIDPKTNLIVLHEESWDIAPMEGVAQIFRRPTTKVKA